MYIHTCLLNIKTHNALQMRVCRALRCLRESGLSPPSKRPWPLTSLWVGRRQMRTAKRERLLERSLNLLAVKVFTIFSQRHKPHKKSSFWVKLFDWGWWRRAVQITSAPSTLNKPPRPLSLDITTFISSSGFWVNVQTVGHSREKVWKFHTGVPFSFLKVNDQFLRAARDRTG